MKKPNLWWLVIIGFVAVMLFNVFAPNSMPTPTTNSVAAPGTTVTGTAPATGTVPVAPVASSQPVVTTFDQVQKELIDSPAKVKKITFIKSGPVDAVNAVKVDMVDGTSQLAPIPGDAGSTRLLDEASKSPQILIDAVTVKKPDESGGTFSTILEHPRMASAARVVHLLHARHDGRWRSDGQIRQG